MSILTRDICRQIGLDRGPTLLYACVSHVPASWSLVLIPVRNLVELSYLRNYGSETISSHHSHLINIYDVFETKTSLEQLKHVNNYIQKTFC